MIIKYRPQFGKGLGGIWLALGIVGVAIFLAVLLAFSKEKPEPIKVVEKAWLVSAQMVTPADWAPTITLYGKVESLWSSSLTAGIVADVINVAVIAGNSVTKGEALVQLDDRDAVLLLTQREADVDQAEAGIKSEMVRIATDRKSLPSEKQLLALAQKEVDRLQGLVKKKVTSQSSLDIARQAVERQAISVNRMQQSVDDHAARLQRLEAQLSKAEAQRDKAALEVERAIIRAPFDGRIAQVFVAPGRRVRIGDRLLEIFDSNALVFKALIPNQYVARISAAMRANEVLKVSGNIDGQKISAKLLSLSAAVSEGSGGVEGLFEIDAGDQILQQGRLSQISLLMPSLPGLIALPPEAIYGTGTVYKVTEDSRLQHIQVERIGETTDDQGHARVLIRSDQLLGGETIVTTQLPSAVEGLRVELVN